MNKNQNIQNQENKALSKFDHLSAGPALKDRLMNIHDGITEKIYLECC